MLNNAAPAENLLVLGMSGRPGWQHLMRVMSETQHILEMPRTSLAARVRGKLEMKLSNRDYQRGKVVWDASAWCENCIREAMQCIDNLPADYYDDNEPETGDEDYLYSKWLEEQNWWQSSDSAWWPIYW